MTMRERRIQNIRRFCLLMALGLPTTNVGAQGRSDAASRGEIAIELFGLIADESACPTYAAAWIDRVTQQVQTRCAETLDLAKTIIASSRNKTRFLIDIAIAKSGYEKRFGSKIVGRLPSLLANFLGQNRDENNSRNASAPVLIYMQFGLQNQSSIKVAIPKLLPRQSGPIIVFQNQ